MVVIALTALTGASEVVRGDFHNILTIERAGAEYRIARDYNPLRDSIDFLSTFTDADSKDDISRWRLVPRQPISADAGIAAPILEFPYARTGPGSLLSVERNEAIRSLEFGVDQTPIELPPSFLGDELFQVVSAPAKNGVDAVVPEPAILVLMLVGLPIVIARPRRARAR